MDREQRLEAATRSIETVRESLMLLDGTENFDTAKRRAIAAVGFNALDDVLDVVLAALGDEVAPTHDWLAPGEEPNRSRWTTCRQCGKVRREDGKPDSSCRGPVPVTLRDEAALLHSRNGPGSSSAIDRAAPTEPTMVDGYDMTPPPQAASEPERCPSCLSTGDGQGDVDGPCTHPWHSAPLVEGEQP